MEGTLKGWREGLSGIQKNVSNFRVSKEDPVGSSKKMIGRSEGGRMGKGGS